jgi:hypothetical protein
LDFEGVLADQRGVRRKEFAQPDGSHISKQGYEALTHNAEGRLRTSGSPARSVTPEGSR